MVKNIVLLIAFNTIFNGFVNLLFLIPSFLISLGSYTLGDLFSSEATLIFVLGFSIIFMIGFSYYTLSFLYFSKTDMNEEQTKFLALAFGIMTVITIGFMLIYNDISWLESSDILKLIFSNCINSSMLTVHSAFFNSSTLKIGEPLIICLLLSENVVKILFLKLGFIVKNKKREVKNDL